MLAPRFQVIIVALALVAGVVAGARPSEATASGLTGAGSTTIAPLMANWVGGFESRESVPVTYHASSSSAGISQVGTRAVDFGSSDAPMTTGEAAACNGCVQVPWALSATGVTFNVPGIKKLRLNGVALAGIYLGTITRWNDPRIEKMNPETPLPSLAITPVFRSDESGETYAFSDYLSKTSPIWRQRVGTQTTVDLSTGVGAADDAGVVSTVARTSGAIGYVASSYLEASSMAVAAVRNAAGNFEYPNLVNIQSAGSTVRSVPTDDSISITDPPRRARVAYPIASFDYAIVAHDAPQSILVQQFITYAITAGERFGAPLDFAPLPKPVVAAARRALLSLAR